jgi:hypothetical protein
MYRRRELATSVETRTRFPELVIHEEKRVRFVVVNGLDIVEKPSDLPIEEAEWFKRLTGRNEVAISARDYKFYCPRRKHRRLQNSVSSINGLPTFPGIDSSTLANTQGFREVSAYSFGIYNQWQILMEMILSSSNLSTIFVIIAGSKPTTTHSFSFQTSYVIFVSSISSIYSPEPPTPSIYIPKSTRSHTLSQSEPSM